MAQLSLPSSSAAFNRRCMGMTREPADEPFSGAKIALIYADQLLTYKRDMKARIPFPGIWDLPGGDRVGRERPIACALREVEEELGIRITESIILWRRRHPSTPPQGGAGWF